MSNFGKIVSESEIYDRIFDELNIYFFQYNVIKKTIIVPEKTRNFFQCREIYENMPASFADDIVAEEYRESFFRLYEDCNSGKDNCECVFEDKNHTYLLSVKLQIIASTIDDRPVMAIGVVENQQTVRQLIRKHTRYIDAILSDSVGYMEVNLSRNEIQGHVIYTRDMNSNSVVSEFSRKYNSNKYNEFERWWSENMLASDKETFLSVSNCEYLISCFEQGMHVVDVFCNTMTETGDITEDKQTYYLSRDDLSGDVVAMCVVYDMTQKNRQKRAINHKNFVIRKLCDRFDAICCVNLDKGMVIDYRLDSVWDSWSDKRKGQFDYFERVEQFADAFVLEEDREKYKYGMSPEVIKEKLKENPYCVLDYRVKDKDTDEVHYFSVRMLKDETDKQNFSVIMGIRNIDVPVQQHKLLQETMRYAEHASKAKLDFLSNMSHDMRTPMNAIIGFTALTAAHLDDKEKAKGYLEKIASSSNHLLSLINDILDMSRIESGKVVLNESEENLADILHDLRTMVQPQVDAKQMDFFIDICDVKNQAIYCDKLRLKQVLLNVFSNAVKYTAPGGTVSIRIIQKDKQQRDYGNYEFHIKDNGKGMSKEFLQHIFEPFTREEQHNSDANPGTGLGLSIVKNIVDMMNGKIEVKSELGKGSEFIISLTFKLQKGNHTEYDFKTEETVVPMDFTGKKVLLAEDIEINQEIANEILTDRGFEVKIANNGQEAVKLLESAKPGEFDIVLMDIRMPIMDGYEATKTIRQLDSEYRNIPIVAMTANAFEDDRQMSFRVGMNEHVSKPLDEEYLFTVLRDLLN